MLINKNVVISSDLTLSSCTFTSKIDIGFDPDVVVVRQITYNTLEDFSYFLVSDLVAGGCLGSFTSNKSVCPNITHILKKPIQGTFTFQVKENATTLSTHATGMLVVNLEFIKY